MRIINIKESEIDCNSCGATLGYTSHDIKTISNGIVNYIVCPICNNPVLIDINK